MKHTGFTDYTRPWFPPPNRLEKWILFVSSALLIAFAANTVNRGAFLKRRMTDAQVYFRAAWSLWSKTPLYEITDDNGWHFHYMPNIPAVMRPFANAPPGQKDLSWTMPYPVSLAVWFVLSFAALAYAIILFGRALDRFVLNRPLQHVFFHQCWLLRFGTFLAFLLIAGAGLSRGQFTPFILLSMTGFAVAYADRRPIASGVWLSLGIAIKLFPGVLLLVPILRRDWRCITAVAVSCLIGLFVIPAVLVGPSDTVNLYMDWVSQRFLGFVSGSVDSVAGGVIGLELSPLAADMIGFAPLFIRFANLIPGIQVTTLVDGAVWAHWFCSMALLGLVVWAGYKRCWTIKKTQPEHARSLLLFSALITAVCVPIVTVSQVHYWTLAIPLFMFLTAHKWRRQGRSDFNIGIFMIGVCLWIGYLMIELHKLSQFFSLGWITFFLTGLAVNVALRMSLYTDDPD